MLKVEGVKKNFGEKSVLKGVDFKAGEGEITVLCGQNAAGKTTLIRILLNIMRKDDGRVEIKVDSNEIAFMFHKEVLFPDITLKENLKFFIKARSKNTNEGLLDKYLKLFELKAELNNRISKFSSGMKKKAELLRVIIEEPKFMILDEPTANLDPLSKIEVREILKKINKDKNCTIFMTSHNLDEVEKIGDKILILDKGKIGWEGDMEMLKREKMDMEEKFLEVVKGRKDE